MEITPLKELRQVRKTFMLIAALWLIAATPLAFGQSPASEGFLTRSYLSGDWGGARSYLAEHGMTLDLRLSLIHI